MNFNQLINGPLQIYPNPTGNTINIVGSAFELEEIVVFNSIGQNVTTRTTITNANKGKIVLDLSQLNTGMYFVKTKTTTNKVYKQ